MKKKSEQEKNRVDPEKRSPLFMPLKGEGKSKSRAGRCSPYQKLDNSKIIPRIADQKIRNKIIKMIGEGARVVNAARAVGITDQAIYHYLNKGFAEDAVEPYKSFAIDYKKAEETYKHKCIKKLNELGFGEKIVKSRRPGNPMALTWTLTKRFPTEFNIGEGVPKNEYIPPEPGNRLDKVVDKLLNPHPDLVNALAERGKKILIVDVEESNDLDYIQEVFDA